MKYFAFIAAALIVIAWMNKAAHQSAIDALHHETCIKDGC